MAAKVKSSELKWANEVMEVYGNLGTETFNQRWSSESAKYMHTWVREDAKNEEKFLTTMVLKATDTLAKHGVTDTADAVLEIDTKTIKDLKVLLADALDEAKQITPKVKRAAEPVVEDEWIEYPVKGPEPEPVLVNPHDGDTELEPTPELEDLF